MGIEDFKFPHTTGLAAPAGSKIITQGKSFSSETTRYQTTGYYEAGHWIFTSTTYDFYLLTSLEININIIGKNKIKS
jgi:hypothetical protein